MPIAFPELEIKEALKTLLGSIERSDGAGISEGMARVDGLLESERHKLRAQLVHFLERRSYAKALTYLGGEANIPSGTCGVKGRADPR